ncbi:MAG: type IV secretory system conjugative DNA transfer family protein [Actinomycetota bacterium]|nr:type IV secretory system conjugative DNA transfer family protein [Actinomycetota bacterium]
MSSRARAEHSDGSAEWEKAALAGLVALIGAGFAVWVTGELAGFLTSGTWMHVAIEKLGGVFINLVKAPGDPAHAWPRQVRHLLPGPVLFYAVLVPVVTGIAVSGGVIWRAATRALGERTSNRASKWATLRDLRPLIVAGPAPSRLVLGRVGSKLIAGEERQSVIVLGPTQSGKTTGFAIPALLEWQGPVLATSVKNDLLRDTIAARARRGGVWVYDPTSSTGLTTNRWSPLQTCSTWRGAQQTSSWLSSAARGTGSGLADADFWYAAGAKALAPYLFAAAISGGGMSDVTRWINTQEQREVAAILQAADIPQALEAAVATWKREPRQKSSVFTTVETVLAAYEDPMVASSATDPDVTPEHLLDGTWRSLYVVSPSHEQRRLRPLFETLLQAVINSAFELSAQRGRPLDPPLLVVLDEAANIAPLRDLDTLASTAASHGIQLVSVFQDLAQISNRYAERTQTVVNNHRAKIIASGISDTQTLEYASRLLGDEEVLQSSVTRGRYGARSTTESVALRNMAPAHVLRTIRPGEAIVVYGHLPPARLRLRPWFRDKAFTQPK